MWEIIGIYVGVFIVVVVALRLILWRWRLNSISIQIDDCHWGEPVTIRNESMRLIHIAFNLHTEFPPVNVTGVQLTIENGLQTLVDSNPPIPFTQNNTRGCYTAKFGFSYSSPNFTIGNEVKKYKLRIMAQGKWLESREFSPRDFSRL
jgi:hypothetical protein